MKKKAPASKGIDDMKSLIHSHAEFFDNLIELIPAKFYQAKDEDSTPWYQGLSKAAKASLKQQSRQNLKLARRQRFDPESKASSSAPNQDSLVNFEEDMDQGEQNQSVTYEELRQKLRRKIEVMRGNRGTASDDKNVKNNGKKRKRGGEFAGGISGKEVESEDAEEIIEYGKVRLGDDEELTNRRKKKKGKLSKVKELERAQRLQEVKREKSGFAERESWMNATNRAMGVKVHDNSRLIKESMKRERRKKEKSSEKWKEREETTKKIKEQRQQKRKDNIEGRIKDKKMRKIAKREKKLMRPGFEGRKDSYITQE
ncbi:ribosomal RNA-processing protein 14-C-like [Dorcoceras hygrometricum]|uniref:Ribosomal RNA-processing protein 14-C-like n=1 Tax=Dorcoceras hygrometricum TaxID=472368 RepID=A0A2Z7BSV0_9LAMI|nr:ribosomal RNA-processing protein 14-C-like [Dorcoceras hygrometricum]